MPEPITLIGVGGGILGLTAHLARRYFEAAKELADVVLGLLLAVIALPVVVFCAILVRLSSRGPVFFVQQRVGRDGKAFRMYKLRTMYADAEAKSGAVWACKDDPRVVRGAQWIRRSHLDELPQLLNVIRGEMSLVGPRPERPEILAELQKVYPNVAKRLTVRPGITGLAQVRNGYDTSVEAFRNKLAADLEYIERRKWSMEISILLRTFGKLKDKSAH